MKKRWMASLLMGAGCFTAAQAQVSVTPEIGLGTNYRSAFEAGWTPTIKAGASVEFPLSSDMFSLESPACFTCGETMKNWPNLSEVLKWRYDADNFDWGVTAGVRVETNCWVMKEGYDLFLGKESSVDPVVINYHIFILLAGYKFIFGK